VFCDFAGAALRGERGYVDGYEVRCSRPAMDTRLPPTVQDNLFALGLVLYELGPGGRPYEGVEDEKVVRLYGRGMFAWTESTPRRSVVMKCWTGGYESASAVMLDLEKVLAAQG